MTENKRLERDMKRVDQWFEKQSKLGDKLFEKLFLGHKFWCYVSGVQKMPEGIKKQISGNSKKKNVCYKGKTITVVTSKDDYETKKLMDKVYTFTLENPLCVNDETYLRAKFLEYLSDFPTLVDFTVRSKENYKQAVKHFFEIGRSHGCASYDKGFSNYWYQKEATQWKNIATCYAWESDKEGFNHVTKEKYPYSSFSDYYKVNGSAFVDEEIKEIKEAYENSLPQWALIKMYEILQTYFMHGKWLGIKERIISDDKKEVVRRFKEQLKKDKERAVELTKQLLSNSKNKSKYPPELRLKIVSEYQVDNKKRCCTALSEKYNVPLGAVYSWVYAAYGYSD